MIEPDNLIEQAFKEIMPSIRFVPTFQNLIIDNTTHVITCLHCGVKIDTRIQKFAICNCQGETKIRTLTLPDHVELTFPKTSIKQLQRNFPLFAK